MLKKKLLAALLSIICFTANAGYVPVALTYFNHDVIANGIGAAASSTTVDVDATGSGFVFISADFQQTSTATLPLANRSLPLNGLITSAATTGLTFQLANYTGNNVCQLTSAHATDSLGFVTPAAFGELSFLVSSGNGVATMNVTVNFTDGTTQTSAAAYTIFDWFQGTLPASTTLAYIGRAARSTGVLDAQGTSVTGPNLYEIKFAINATNYTKNIRSVTFNRVTTSSGAPHILGITGATVCSGSVTAGTTSSSAGTSACSAVNFNLSLPTATTGVGISYQWQSSTTGGAPWTTIAGATTATYTANQTVATTYRAYIICTGSSTSDTSTPITVTMKPASQCYCIPVATTNTYYINSFATTGGTTNITNNNNGVSTTSIGYSDFSGTMTVSAMQGNTVNFTSAYTGGTFGTKVYVDWNQNGLFTDAGETMFGTSAYAASASGSFQVPPNALAGNTRLRIRVDFLNSAGPAPCGTIANTEAEDYTFNVIPLPSCTGTPAAGVATASMDYICPTESLILTSSSGNLTGLTNQWEFSTNNGVTWNDIVGATTNPYTLTGQTVTTLYRDKQVCTLTSSPTVYSNVDTVRTRACYCTPSFTAGCASWRLTNVAFGSINNSPATCTISDYTGMSTTVIASVPFPMSITTNQFAAATVYIDLNNDGDFNDVDEMLYQEPYSGLATSTVTPNITVPAYAAAGHYRLRVVCKWGGASGIGEACTAFPATSYGNFHDYTLNVLAATPCTAPATQPTSLVLTPAVTTIAGSFTASIPVADKYLVLRTPGTATPTVAPVSATVYTVGASLGNATVISAGTNTTSFTDATASPATQYRYTVYGYNDLCVGGPTYNTTVPLTATVTTIGVTTYTWTGATSTDWQIAGNWTPSRITPDPTDLLQFNNGIVDSVTNIPTQTVSRILITNNTIATFKAQTTATRTLTINADNNAATNELRIDAGSSLISLGTASILAIKYGGTTATAYIAGTLEINNTATGIANTFDFSNAIDTIAATGILAAGGTIATSVFTSTATNLVVLGTYQHKYTTVGGGNVPTATWGSASNVLISGYTTSTGGPAGGLSQTFNNFTYNAPLQTANTQWSATLPTIINGSLSVVSTGTGQWQMAAGTAYTITTNNYTQTAGIVDLGTGATAKTMNVAGVFSQTGGIIKATGAGAVTLNFNGTAAAQNVSFLDSAATGPIVYRVSNPFGINLNGTGALTTTPVFKINTGGGVQISSSATNPINTTFTLTYFATGTTLTYDGTANQAVTSAIWPTTNGPLNFTINNTGTTPANQVTLPGARTVAGTLTVSSGVLVLGSNNLTVSNNAAGAISIATPSATKMIAADGTGQLIRAMGTTASSTYLFPIGDVTGTVEYAPVSLTMVTSAGARLMAIRVVNAHNVNDASTNYLNRYWVITDTATSAYTYNGSFTYTTADIVGTEANLRLSEWNGTAWTQIPSLPNTGVLTIQNIQSSAQLPLAGMQITGRTAAPNNTYTWNGLTSTDFQVASNWTPARNIPDPGDYLLFNNGIVDTVKNIPTQSITRLTFSGTGTKGVFQAPAANTLTILSDNLTTTDEFSISSSDTLLVNGNSFGLTLAFSGTGATATIAGQMESVSNAVNNIFNFTNGIVTVTATGTIAEGGSNAASAVTGTTAANFLVYGLFNYKYTTNTVGLPQASWNTGSTLLISGYTTAAGGPNGGQNQAFYNLTYNCPNQTSAANWSGTGALSVANNLTVASTGTGSWQFAGTQPFTANIGNFIQTGGIFNIASGVSTGVMSFNVSGTLNQTGGTFIASGASTAANSPIINFNGTTTQSVNFFNVAPTGPITYRITNPAGINLTGTGTFTTTPAFNINSNGGVRISTVAANPINTTLALTYAATGSLLTYDSTFNVTATASVWPSVNGPYNVTINKVSSNSAVTLPFNRSIVGTLTMTSGDIDMGANVLTLGSAVATPGTLTYTAGNIRLTTGQFVRFFGTTGLPTAATTTGVGFYPISYGTANRNVSLYFSTATAFSTGGSIGIGHNNVNGFTTGLSVADGTYVIDTRTNSNWTFATSGVVLNGTATISAKISGSALFTSNNPANLRVMKANAVAGIHSAGSGFSAVRTGLLVSDLTVPYYIGAAAIDINPGYIAIATGNWSAPATWLGGLVPGATNDAFINPGVVVSADLATNTAKSLNILAGGTLNVNTATAIVTIDSAVQNNGVINMGGGVMVVNGNSGISGIINNVGALFNVSAGSARVGPLNGGNKSFSNSGTLTVSGGTLNINGNLALNANSILNQSGGDINVDGNAGSLLASSVAAGTPIVNILTPNLNLTAGNFTVVDPHIGASTNTFVYNAATSANASGTHTFIAGNGTSTDTGFNAAYGLSVNTNITAAGKLAFMNVVVNSGTAPNSWLVFGASVTGVLGNFTVNAAAEHRQGGTGNTLYIGGNLVNNGTYTCAGGTYFGMYTSGTATSSLAAQSVSGTGTFRNLVTAPTGKFYKIQVQNNYGVTFNIGDIPFSNNVTMLASAAPAPVGPSKLIMASGSILTELAGASQTTSATAGWIVGRYQKAAGSTGGFSGTLPVGDMNNYAPIVFNTASVTTTGSIWGSTTTLDHPNIATSSIVAAKSVNRYYTLTPVGGIVFAPNSAVTVNWTATDVDPGANTAVFSQGKYASSAWTYTGVASPAATSIQLTGVNLNVAGDYEVGEPCSAILIATQPTNVSACLGSSATLSVGLTSPSNVTYQWYKGTSLITGATSATYTIPTTALTDAGTYSVQIGSLCPAVTTVASNAVTLTVNVPAAINTQPAAQSICEGSPVTFTVGAVGTGITYQWQKNGANIPGATLASYTIPIVAPADAGNYGVIVTGSAPCGFVASNAVALTVNSLPLTITPQTTTTFCPGGSVVICASSTPGTLTYAWNQNGSALSGQTSSCFTATASGSYTATITNTANGCSNTSNAVVVSVNGAPQATITPAGTASFCTGGSIVLHTLNTPGLIREWYLNGILITGATDSVYTAAAGGSYTVKIIIGSGCSSTSTPTVVSVTPLPTITTTPTGAQAICQNDTLLLTAFYSSASLVWKFNGVPIVPAATGTTYKATAAGSYTVTITSTTTGCQNTSAPVLLTLNPLPTVNVISANAATFCAGGADTLKASPTTGLTYEWSRNNVLITPSVTAANYPATTSGSYTVTVTNANGCKKTSTPIVVTVNPLPNVLVTPSLPLTICAGQINSLCVPSAASQTYQWSNATGPITGATSSCYAATTSGTYSVYVVNTATTCSATSNLSTVVVNPLPTAAITAPASSVACAGDTVCLNANTGTGLTYQWKLNGSNIPGATNATYCATGGGNYSVVVTNANSCSAISAIQILTFNPRPTSSITYTTPVTFCEGGAVVLTGVSNNGTSYQWQNNGTAIPGANTLSYIATTTGNYSVIVTNSFGCSTTSPTIIVVSNPNPNAQITRSGQILSTGNYATYQWYFNSQPVNGANGQSYFVTQNGGYAVAVTDANGCTDYSDVYFFNNLGVGTINVAAIKVFPNPVHNILNISAPDKVNVTIRDLTGRQVMKVDNARQIDMSHLADGTYLLMISDKNGVMVKTEKLTKVSE